MSRIVKQLLAASLALTLFLSGTALAAPMYPTSLGFKASRTSIHKGQKVVFSGKLKAPFAKCKKFSTVTLYRNGQAVGVEEDELPRASTASRSTRRRRGPGRSSSAARPVATHPNQWVCKSSQLQEDPGQGHQLAPRTRRGRPRASPRVADSARRRRRHRPAGYVGAQRSLPPPRPRRSARRSASYRAARRATSPASIDLSRCARSLPRSAAARSARALSWVRATAPPTRRAGSPGHRRHDEAYERSMRRSPATPRAGRVTSVGPAEVLEVTSLLGHDRHAASGRSSSRVRACGPASDFLLAYSPERVDPGNAEFGMRNTPRVVGGSTPEATDDGRRVLRARSSTR